MENSTCTTCRVPLSSQEDSRNHYKSDFHTYNLKRKYVSLGPVSFTIYEQKQKEMASLTITDPKKIICECCKQEFQTQKALYKHVKRNQVTTEQKAIDCDLTCLFCNLVSENIESNLKHMLQLHGFFIPNLECVKDLDSLLKYLHKKIRELYICLYCNHRKGHNFNLTSSVQQHMIDKQHCFLNTDEDEEEFKRFYVGENDSSYEIISSEEESKSDHYIDLGSQSSESYSYSIIGNNSVKVNGEILPTGELRLNNGKIVGNKEYARFYKQFYRPPTLRIQQLLEIVEESHENIGTNYQWRSNRELPSDDIREKMLKQGLKNNMLQHYLRKQV